MRIAADFEGHSTQRPLKMRVERGPDADPADDEALATTLVSMISSALNVKTSVSIVASGSLDVPGAAKVQLVERAPA
jgi:phenylacetate-CoA ligase